VPRSPARTLLEDLRSGRIKVAAGVVGSAPGYPDERVVLRDLLAWAQASARPQTWGRTSLRTAKDVIQAVVDLQGVQARAGIDLDAHARRIRLNDATTAKEIRGALRETRAIIDTLFRARAPGDYLPCMAEAPASVVGLTASRDEDGTITLIWRISNWRAAFRVTLALLLHEHAREVGRCPECDRVWMRPATRRGRPPLYCDRRCAGRARQRRHRARG
jgi:hypothetical protein